MGTTSDRFCMTMNLNTNEELISGERTRRLLSSGELTIILGDVQLVICNAVGAALPRISRLRVVPWEILAARVKQKD